VHPNESRHKEIVQCLKNNQANSFITNIFLLNEKIFTQEELGLQDLTKITQLNIQSRLEYSHVFNESSKHLNCWNILCNADIFFDDSLKNLFLLQTDKNLAFSLLRWEYPSNKIFGPRADSQDSWIWHSNNQNLLLQNLSNFTFQIGMPGCDNRIAYEFDKIGLLQCNAPNFIKSHHVHSSNIRNYKKRDTISRPYLKINPIL
jgi:hypothetical protein